jgi:hypothetical protein
MSVCCLLPLWVWTAHGFSTDNSSPVRSFNRTAAPTNSPVVVSVNFTNQGAGDLRGFYYADQVPSGLVVTPLSMSLNGSGVAGYALESGLPDEVCAGCTPYRWMLEQPPFFPESNPVPLQGVVQIAYSVSSPVAGMFRMQDYSWAALRQMPTTNAVLPGNLPTAGLIGFYRADEQGGGTMINRATNALRLSNSTELSNPDWGTNCVGFLGTNSYAQFLSSNAIITNRLTFAGWFYFPAYSTTGDACILLWSPDVTVRNGFVFHTVPEGYFRLRYHSGPSNTWTGGDFPWSILSTNTWHHIACAINLSSSSGKVTVYVDGTVRTLAPYGTGVSTSSVLDTGIWRLASYAPPSSNNCSFSVRGMTFFNRTLSVGEITDVMAATAHLIPLGGVAGSGPVFGCSEATDQQTLNFISTVPPPLLNGELAPSGLVLSLDATLGVYYSLQESTNLTDWIPVVTNSAPFSYTDTNMIRYSWRFFRAMQLPQP